MYLKEGDIIELKEGMCVYADIPKHFVYSNKRGCFDLTHSVVDLSYPDFDYLLGEYIVTKTTFDGGGTGMGCHDVYPDGRHVYCVKADNPDVKVDFYQSGCFTAMIEDIKPIGEAKLKWVIY